jgi:hypothetical protein
MLTMNLDVTSLYAQLKSLPWRHIPAGHRHDRGHGREERRTLQVATVSAGLAFPHAAPCRCNARDATRVPATLGISPA